MLLHNLTAGMHLRRLRIFIAEKGLSSTHREVDAAGSANPDQITDVYWCLHIQPRDAWTFEHDLRPALEWW